MINTKKKKNLIDINTLLKYNTELALFRINLFSFFSPGSVSLMQLGRYSLASKHTCAHCGLSCSTTLHYSFGWQSGGPLSPRPSSPQHLGVSWTSGLWLPRLSWTPAPIRCRIISAYHRMGRDLRVHIPELGQINWPTLLTWSNTIHTHTGEKERGVFMYDLKRFDNKTPYSVQLIVKFLVELNCFF